MKQLVLGLCLVLVPMATACEKSNDIVVQEQFQDAQNGCPKGCSFPPPGCRIKGNISGAGRKFYIMPGDKRYDIAIIEPSKGEAWFCTTREAEKNDFKPVPPGV